MGCITMPNMDAFASRRAIERLRDGLSDPLAVSRLTIEEEEVNGHFAKGLKALDHGKADYLCICGCYGQGKSHTLNHLRREAMSKGYATSLIQLDMRQVPFNHFDIVYRVAWQHLALPDGQRFADRWKESGSLQLLESLPKLPHRFRMILSAMLLYTHHGKEAQEALIWLENALMGHEIALVHLKQLLDDCGLQGFRKHPLTCQPNADYMFMVQALGAILKEMGYKGLVLFFDEAESITQGRVNQRARSYMVLDHFFFANAFVYPIFALTDDFFMQVSQEQYENDKDNENHSEEKPRLFLYNYAERWQQLSKVRLKAFSPQGWHTLQMRLVELYAHAYGLDLASKQLQLQKSLQNLLETIGTGDTRATLKALVHQLDIETCSTCIAAP